MDILPKPEMKKMADEEIESVREKIQKDLERGDFEDKRTPLENVLNLEGEMKSRGL